MKILENLAAFSFRVDADGSSEFYPYGKRRSGYLVRTEAERTKITAGLKTHYTRLGIYLFAIAVLSPLPYFHTLTHFSSFMQTVFLVGAAGVWGYRNFLTETTASMPVADKQVTAKSIAPQIFAIVLLVFLVGFVIFMSSRLPSGKLPETLKNPVAVPATAPGN